MGNQARFCGACGARIESEGAFCAGCGVKRENKPASASPVVALFRFFVACCKLGCAMVALLVLFAIILPKQPKSGQEVAQPAQSVITLAKFESLRTGMTYEDVCGVLGRRGEELSSTELAGYRTVMYSWKTDEWGIANMNATFQNGQMISKAQLGLK